VAATKPAALDAQYARHPENFVHGPPVVALPEEISINPIVEEKRAAGLTGEINFSTLPAAAETLSKLTFK
jgi:hypothetical protein